MVKVLLARFKSARWLHQSPLDSAMTDALPGSFLARL
jgi:hypothetical protein